MFKNFLIALVLLVLMGAAGWWYWTTTPTYAAYEIVDSVKTHDLARFQKYVDIDSVSDGIVDDLLAGPQNQAKQAGILPQILTSSITAFIKPGLVAVTKEQIIKLVGEKPAENSSSSANLSSSDSSSHSDAFNEPRRKLASLLPTATTSQITTTQTTGTQTTGTQTTATQTATTAITTGNAPRKKFRFVGISPVRKNGDFAEVSVYLRSNDDVPQELTIDLRIQDVNNHWQLKRILNSPQMFNALAKTGAGQAIIRRLVGYQP